MNLVDAVNKCLGSRLLSAFCIDGLMEFAYLVTETRRKQT